MAQQKGEMGRLAVSYLVEFIENPERFRREPVHHVLAPTLLIRRSCGALGAGRAAAATARAVPVTQGGAS